ncbi:MAG: Uma2 family endonuclease [Phycisphaerae bacterium]|nr:Uma2 family endonuclease [Saprospiraceae bacterium]
MRESLRFYDALPKHKAELVDGQMYIGGSLAKSAMALGYMVEKLGAAYVANLVPKDLLQDAVIEVYGNPAVPIEKMADFNSVEPYYYRPQKVATDLRMGLFSHHASVWGGTLAVKLDQDVFMPDVFVLKNESNDRMHNSYLDGPPDLVIEVVTPYMRSFDFGIRLERYASAGVPEIWMLDLERRSFEPMRLELGSWLKSPIENEVFASTSIPGLTVQHKKMFDSAEEMGLSILDIFEVPDSVAREKLRLRKDKDELGWGSVPFAPRLALKPVHITFEEFISWGGEVKFEMMDGKPIFGGGNQTTKEWLGLLMMSLGLAETVKYLPGEEWSKVF